MSSAGTTDPTLLRAWLGGPEARASLRDQGAGRAVLVLHGGGGPGTVTGLAQALAGRARVLTPTHPGFGGTARPAWLAGMAGLATLYLGLLDELGLERVVVVGSSIGGWIGCEMALQGGDRVEGLVLIDAVGIEVPGEAVADVFSLTPQALTALAFHDPSKTPARGPPTPEQRAMQAGNFAALAAYDGGLGMQDPGLRARLAAVSAPALVIWGESDGVASPRYGQAYADALRGARFERVERAGHLPQIEQPAAVAALVEGFLDAHPAASA